MAFNYKENFIKAVRTTEQLGFVLPKNILPLKKRLSTKKQRDIQMLCVEALRRHGFHTSEDLATQCTGVHLMLRDYLKSHMNVDSYITIGDRFWDDYIYCEMSYASIEKELKFPDFSEPIKAHVWLTLADGTILDFTAEAHADLLFNRGVHPMEQCMMYIAPEDIRKSSDGYHRPYLVGEQFLEKVGVFKRSSQ